MKKLIILSAVFFLLNNGLSAQKPNDSVAQLNKTELSHSYYTKAKHQKVAAIVMAGGGAAMGLIGLSLFVSNAKTNFGNALTSLFTLTPMSNPHKNRGVAVMVIGFSAMAASIPIALASARNKRTATLMLQNQTAFITPSLHLKQPCVSLLIPLGR